MTIYPPGDRNAHQKFCEIENWAIRTSARGVRGTDHVRYELHLRDGRVLYTRISRPVDRTTYSSSMWSHILRDQLQVTEAEFWECIRSGKAPKRGRLDDIRPAIPLSIAYQLRRLGVEERDIAAMTRDEAIARLHDLRSGELGG